MIYLDNCATTKVREKVLEKMYDSFKEDFGNPSSLHRLGLKSEKKIKESREIIAEYLRVDSKELFFTSGGTESNNIAIQSIIKGSIRKGNHIITTKIEHPSVLNVMKDYEEKGFNVTYLDVDKEGRVDLDQFRNSISKDTILVSIIHVNNEIGTFQDINKIKEIMKEKNPNALLHLDGVQSFGKIDFNLKQLGVDTYSFSGHKVHGPKGIGGLYIRKGLNLSPIVFGGNQENGLRSGTENVQGIIGLGEAVRLLSINHQKDSQHVSDLKEYMIRRLNEEIDHIKINTPKDNSSPYILNVSFLYTRGEVLLHYLEEKEIYVSTGSACSSKGTDKSHVLVASGLSDKEIEGAIRMCFSYETTKEDIDYVINQIKDSVKDIRKIMMR
ncbi:MAG: cysteine desulfurase family protein [Tissierellaceae bacterium]|nr:cysteine desulfurase family protein [Tissierellaceae bacterium]